MYDHCDILIIWRQWHCISVCNVSSTLSFGSAIITSNPFNAMIMLSLWKYHEFSWGCNFADGVSIMADLSYFFLKLDVSASFMRSRHLISNSNPTECGKSLASAKMRCHENASGSSSIWNHHQASEAKWYLQKFKMTCKQGISKLMISQQHLIICCRIHCNASFDYFVTKLFLSKTNKITPGTK